MAAQNTSGEERLQQALLDLMDEKPFERISVSDVVRRANANRKTWYYHYYDKTDAIDAIIDRLLAPPEAVSGPDLAPGELASDDEVLASLAYVRRQAGTLSTLMASSMEPRLRERWIELFVQGGQGWLSGAGFSDGERELATLYMYEGYYGIVKRWVLGGCVTPEEDLVALFRKLWGRILLAG